MQKIKSIDTTPEVLFKKALWQRGIRYRKNNKYLPGKPDISISKYNLAVFIDGEFWHGFEWESKKGRIKANRDYWIPKIERNMDRDKQNNFMLEQGGWTVLRFWEKNIRKNLEGCIDMVLAAIEKVNNEKT